MRKRKLAVLLAVFLFACFCLCACGEKPNTDTPDDKSGTATGDGDSVLYYNIYGELYDGKADDSLTSREKDLDDGYFHVLTSSDGKIVEVLVKSRILTNKIDSNPVLALTFSEDNIVADALSVEEIGGSIAARNCFVSAVDDGTLLVNTNNTNSGEEIPLTLADAVKIYDVSDEDNGFGGMIALEELEVMDEIVAVADESGAVTHIWVQSKASQNKGRGGCICGANDSGEAHKEGCDGTILYYWQPWTNKTSLPDTGGYWYLDVEGGVIDLDEKIKLRSNMDIYLDLNGHTVNSRAQDACYVCQDESVSIHISILDSKGGGVFKFHTVYQEDGTPTPLQARFAVYVGGKTSLTIYGGTIDGSGLKGSGGNGALIRAINGGTLNIHGGTIIGTSDYANTGGAVFCSGTMNMTGGKITGGHAKKGGNVFMGTYESGGVTYYGTLNMSGGEIVNGTASISGGNLCYYEDGSFNQTGGTVSGGYAPEAPDIYVYPKFDPAA